MILAIESDLPTFKPILFNDGLNVLLSDKAPGSSEKQTRNSAGKSAVVLFGLNVTSYKFALATAE
jgi:uncharacterized protein YydD (DUF2326 family)